MNEHPILFNREMIRALHSGRKTQTRRIPSKSALESINWFAGQADDTPGTTSDLGQDVHEGQFRIWCAEYPDEGSIALTAPYGVPGDSLWVREAWRVSEKHDATAPRDLPFERGMTIMYDAGGSRAKNDKGEYENDSFWPNWPTDRPKWAGKGRPSIHMPRAASRTTIEVTRVRVERLQDITEEDAEAEGVDFLRHVPDADETLSARDLYRILWDSINEARGHGWNTNPWVWVVEFPSAF